MYMKPCFGLFLLSAIYDLATSAHVDKCNLRPSELGPDWYKVTRPIPTGFENDPDYQNSYVHMPCADTTVFDIAVCGCTNLMAYLHTRSSAGKRHHHDHHQTKLQLKPLDLVRTRDPVKTHSPKDKPVGTRLLNIRTGEVRHCPFRASSHGPEWYLVHEPTEAWRPMRCAPGTLFQKRSCTCVHRDLLSKDSGKPEDDNIVVLEEEYGNHIKDNTISKSLGISVADVDFRKKNTDDSVPFWRRKSNQHFNEPTVTPNMNSSAVFVTLNGEFKTFDTNNRLDGFELGKDKIADEHRELLKRLRKGPISNFGSARVNSPMYLALDSKNSDKGAFDPDRHNALKNRQNVDTVLTPDVALTTDKKPLRVNIDEKRNGQIQELNKAITFLGKHHAKNSDETSNKNSKNMKNDDKKLSRLLPVKDEIYFADRECPKKPMPEIGPQWFKFYVWGIGHIPYTCHGNLIYDDKVCACVPVPAESTINEINIPGQGCNKKAVPELGPKYFKMFMWQAGTVRYACTGGSVFDQDICACVPRKPMV